MTKSRKAVFCGGDRRAVSKGSRHSPQCVSLGYQGQSLDGLCRLLLAHDVVTLIDVRQNAWSNRPEFRKGRLKEAVNAVGVEYIHLLGVGNPFRPKPGEELGFAECARRYRKYIVGRKDVLESVYAIACGQVAAVLCYEHESAMCHRSVLLEEVRRCVGPISEKRI